jgi:maleylacetoacetate isomerase
VIRQSIAILEFLEEYFPNKRRLLPDTQDAIARAQVRELVNIIAMDIQPPTNLRILKKVKKITQGDKDAPAEWAKDLTTKGLVAYDKVAEKYAGKYSVGDDVTLADVCLAPAIEGALRYGIDIKQFPTIERIYYHIKALDEFKRGDWKHQEDTPEEFKGDD